MKKTLVFLRKNCKILVGIGIIGKDLPENVFLTQNNFSSSWGWEIAVKKKNITEKSFFMILPSNYIITIQLGGNYNNGSF